jgi:glycosyltransferase involved in cell wall biosynthesis
MIRMHELGTYVTLLGHVAGEELDSVYEHADVVVLTSRSEGIPLVLMEGMARGKIVLAPAITGIPELVIHRKTGFLYEAGSMPGFLTQMLLIHSCTESDKGSRESIDSHAFTELQAVREAAVTRVRQHFERKNNLRSFCELFMERVSKPAGNIAHENFVLQQVQPSL